MSLRPEEIEKFKLVLLDMRARLTKILQGSTQEVRVPDETRGYSQHQADEGSHDLDRAISVEMTVKEFALLGRINRALEKIEEGSYGICDISGEPIPFARLEAVPYAVTTVKSQAELEQATEKQQRMF
ncbi:TraR/DksA family transcriptional regulator [Candidatus Similichlamydia laticola]|uniref:DnaK Suppressor n=1 Tax=Candidatus Similichlamydia laticola TaxID=2170265 RepID=A0A369KCJ6_9BACT|nr:TraR/DksA family transcriptional regulator [Candidatus Similichlamydia laticola]RDB31322.1 DnaK Suppressor [Candidatus Similichlamydia laticola]